MQGEVILMWEKQSWCKEINPDNGESNPEEVNQCWCWESNPDAGKPILVWGKQSWCGEAILMQGNWSWCEKVILTWRKQPWCEEINCSKVRCSLLAVVSVSCHSESSTCAWNYMYPCIIKWYIYICVKSINTRKTTLYEGKDTECNMFAVVCGSSPFSCCTGFQDINVCVGVYIHAYLFLVLCWFFLPSTSDVQLFSFSGRTEYVEHNTAPMYTVLYNVKGVSPALTAWSWHVCATTPLVCHWISIIKT